MVCCCVYFFFSSRRRHTRSLCDWSSDVCSSDLPKSSGPARPSSPCSATPATVTSQSCSIRTSCARRIFPRSEEHTSELQSHSDLVCRLLLEKKKNNSERCRHDKRSHQVAAEN